jgi:hypothetical protein
MPTNVLLSVSRFETAKNRIFMLHLSAMSICHKGVKAFADVQVLHFPKSFEGGSY